MRRFLLGAALLLALACSPRPAVSDTVCWESTRPTPTPAPGQVSFPTCTGGKLDVNASGVATPIPFPTLGVNVLNTPGVTVVAPVPTPTGTAPAAISTPASSATSVTLLAANAARNGYSICNNSTQILDVAFAAAATTSAFTFPLTSLSTIPACFFSSGVGVYKGIITGIWTSANGTAVVTEW
jgi:hypothetical protein